jgi:hypothetical protein
MALSASSQQVFIAPYSGTRFNNSFAADGLGLGRLQASPKIALFQL